MIGKMPLFPSFELLEEEEELEGWSLKTPEQ
jgi:hypothetical protein